MLCGLGASSAWASTQRRSSASAGGPCQAATALAGTSKAPQPARPPNVAASTTPPLDSRMNWRLEVKKGSGSDKGVFSLTLN